MQKKLFNYFHQNHGLSLLDSDIDEVMRIVTDLWFVNVSFWVAKNNLQKSFNDFCEKYRNIVVNDPKVIVVELQEHLDVAMKKHPRTTKTKSLISFTIGNDYATIALEGQSSFQINLTKVKSYL